MEGYGQTGLTFVADLLVDHQPEYTAHVSLSCPDWVVEIANSGFSTCGGVIRAHFEDDHLAVSYKAGENYVLQIVTSIGSSSTTCFGPGNISVSDDGLNVTWTAEGNNDFASVRAPNVNDSYFSGWNDADSPVVIPLSVFNAGPGGYWYNVQCSNSAEVTKDSGYFRITDVLFKTVMKL